MDISDKIIEDLLKECGVILKTQDTIKIYDIIKTEIETKTQDVINKVLLIKSKKTLTMNDINKLHQINEEYIV